MLVKFCKNKEEGKVGEYCVLSHNVALLQISYDFILSKQNNKNHTELTPILSKVGQHEVLTYVAHSSEEHTTISESFIRMGQKRTNISNILMIHKFIHLI